MGGSKKIVLTDGHWGDGASDISATFWLNAPPPSSRTEAVTQTKKLEEVLFDRYVRPNPDPDTFQSPETSFLVIVVDKNKLKIIGYGDCRAAVVRRGKIVYSFKIQETWLGVFSRLGLRNRLSVDEALVFEELTIEDGDTIIGYTDGIDECIYNVPTISSEWLARAVTQERGDIKGKFEAVFQEVFRHGAEDNASLAIAIIE